MNWIQVNSIDDVPAGNWLVSLEKPLMHGVTTHSAIISNNRVVVISGRFGFDCPRVISYCELPLFTTPE